VAAQAVGIVRTQFGMNAETVFEQIILRARRDARTIYGLA